MSPIQLLIVGFFSLACCVVGSGANLLSLCYFLFGNRNKCHISNILFKLINITDLIICLAVLPIAVSAISYGAPQFFGVDILCNTWVFVWYTVSRYSLFLIAVLSVARTHSVLCPLRPQEKSVFLPPIGVYLVLLLLQETFPYWYGEKAHYWPEILSCGWFLEQILDVDSVEYHISHMIFVVVESVVPILIIIVSSILSWSFLCLQNRRRSKVFRATNRSTQSTVVSVIPSINRHENPRGSITLEQINLQNISPEVVVPLPRLNRNKDSQSSMFVNGLRTAESHSRSASFTILIIGGVCLALNIPFGMVIMLSSVELFTDCYLVCLHDMVSHEHFLLIMFLVHTVTIELNSVINPLLYIFRMKRLRSFIMRLIKIY